MVCLACLVQQAADLLPGVLSLVVRGSKSTDHQATGADRSAGNNGQAVAAM